MPWQDQYSVNWIINICSCWFHYLKTFSSSFFWELCSLFNAHFKSSLCYRTLSGLPVFFSSILCSDLRRANCYGFWAPLSMESLVRALGINSLSISAYFSPHSFLCVPAWGVWLPFPTSSLCEREVFPDLGEVEGPSLGDDQGHANVRDDCHLLVSIPSCPCPTSETSRCIPRMRWGSSMRTEVS